MEVRVLSRAQSNIRIPVWYSYVISREDSNSERGSGKSVAFPRIGMSRADSKPRVLKTERAKRVSSEIPLPGTYIDIIYITMHNYKTMKHIVCLGGGNAMPKTVLAGLKNKPVKLTVICAMLDSGGSAGRLRKDYKIVSPGDIRRALIALADTSPILEDLFNYRFEVGELKGHNFANLLITGLELSNSNYEKSLETLHKILNLRHEVLPVTLSKSNLHVELENGKIIHGEGNIDVPKHNGNLKIKRAFLNPRAKAYPRALHAIREADAIVIGPGDLYSSIMQILLTEGVARTICASRAKKIYVCNVMTKYGETNDFSVEDFAGEVEKYLGCKLDYVIYNNHRAPSSGRIRSYRKEHHELLRSVQMRNKRLNAKKFIGVDLLPKSGPIAHDPEKLAKVILQLLRRS